MKQSVTQEETWSGIYDRLMKRCYPIEGSVLLSSRWDLCARKSPYGLHPDSQKFPQHCLWNGSNFRLTDDGPLSSFQGRSPSVSSFHASLLQAIDGVMSLALCPQVVSQTSQHFRSSEKQATCEGCFACQCICLVISPHSSTSRAVHPQEFFKGGRQPLTHSKMSSFEEYTWLKPHLSLLTSQMWVRFQLSCRCNFPSFDCRWYFWSWINVHHYLIWSCSEFTSLLLCWYPLAHEAI